MRRRGTQRQVALLATLVALVLAGLLGTTGLGTSAIGNDLRDLARRLVGAEHAATTGDLAYTPWNEATAPEYHRVIGVAQPGELPAAGAATYAPLDALGRAGRVAACVDYRMMERGRARARGDLRDLTPSGWGHNAEVDVRLPNGGWYRGYLWNRSHLLAKSLGGEDRVENLVCGTRMQNVGSNARGSGYGGMAFCENIAREWLERHPDGTMAYVATPVYEGAELVCRSVIVDMQSSDGSVNQRVEVYNAAAGYVINYADGSFAAA